jgi:hypothetical protein
LRILIVPHSSTVYLGRVFAIWISQVAPNDHLASLENSSNLVCYTGSFYYSLDLYFVYFLLEITPVSDFLVVEN